MASAQQEYVALEEENLPSRRPRAALVALVASLALLGTATFLHTKDSPFWGVSDGVGNMLHEIELSELPGEAEFWTDERLGKAMWKFLRMPPNATAGFNLPPDEDLLADRLGTRADVTSTPAKWVGALFFKQDGDVCSCSAALVMDHVILTARHCLMSERTWDHSTNLIFFPGFSFTDGTPHAPYGKFRLVGLVYSRPAVHSELSMKNVQNDYGFGILDKSPNLGHFGVSVNFPPTGWPDKEGEWMVEYGYPAHKPYPGPMPKHMYQISVSEVKVGVACASELFGLICLDPVQYLYVKHDDFTSGSSGGPWTYMDSDGAYIVGLMGGEAGKLRLSPYFDDEFGRLLKMARKHA